jgi:hypothetical protein
MFVDPKSVDPPVGIVCVVVRVKRTPVGKISTEPGVRLPATENDPSEPVVVSGSDGTDLPLIVAPEKEISTLPLLVLTVMSLPAELFNMQPVSVPQLNTPMVE